MVIKGLRGFLHAVKYSAKQNSGSLHMMARLGRNFPKPELLLHKSTLESVKLNLQICMTLLHLGITVEESDTQTSKQDAKLIKDLR